jgi:hypothetical protein
MRARRRRGIWLALLQAPDQFRSDDLLPRSDPQHCFKGRERHKHALADSYAWDLTPMRRVVRLVSPDPEPTSDLIDTQRNLLLDYPFHSPSPLWIHKNS